MAIAPLAVNPAAAAAAYARTDAVGAAAGPATTEGFGAALGRALEGAVASSHQAEQQSTAALTNGGNLTDVVAAVTKAELALQTTVAVRDRMIQAYQDIMRMPI